MFAAWFALLSLGCGALTPLYGGLAWLLLWPAALLLGVALACGGLGPRPLGKRPGGTRRMWAVASFLPCLVPSGLPPGVSAAERALRGPASGSP